MYVREWQKYLCLTNKEVARRLNISPTTYCKYLHSDMRVSTIERIAEVFSVPCSFLFVLPPSNKTDFCSGFIVSIQGNLFEVKHMPRISKVIY